MKEEITSLQLSVRSMNCLRQEQIYYIDDLIILHEMDLRRIPNMGEKSIDEIRQQLAKKDLCFGMNTCHNTNYKSLYIKKELEINIWLDSIANIDFKQVKLNNFLLCAIDNLTIRSINALNLERTFHNNIIEFLKYLFSLESILILPNIGKTSEFEIQNFLTNTRKEIKHLYQSEKITIHTAIDLMVYMNIPQYLRDEYIKNYPDNNIHFFAIIDLAIKDNLNKKELEILKHRKNHWGARQITLESLGKKLGVTRERVRQIEVKANKKLWSTIRELSTYYTVLNIEKMYDFPNNFIGDIGLINKQDNTHFSDIFLYKILSIFLSNNYQLLINNNDECKFLIKKNIANIFNFNGFIDKIRSLIQAADTDYKLDFKGTLYSYLKLTSSEVYMIEIESICEDLLNFEFGIVLDIDNQIIIKSKKKKSISVYVEEVFNANNQPMHLDDIYNQIKNNYPEFSCSKRYVGNSLAGNNRFIFFDRNSTYGLKSWDGIWTENSNLIHIVKYNKTNNDRNGIKVWSENGKIIVKGGTIINIVIEYLKQFGEPKHINDIFSEVEKWRDTSKFKLISNLKANNRDYFVFHKKGFIGLVNE